MIDKTTFCSVIENLRHQIIKDKNNCIVHNHFLIKSIMDLLRVHFPRDKDGHCALNHFCFWLDFGKLGEEQLITCEDLYDELILKIKKNDTV